MLLKHISSHGNQGVKGSVGNMGVTRGGSSPDVARIRPGGAKAIKDTHAFPAPVRASGLMGPIDRHITF